MALTTNLGLFPPRSLEVATFDVSPHFGTGNNSRNLDQEENMNVDIHKLPQSNGGCRWPQLPTPEYPPTQRDWDNYRSIFTELYQVEDRPLKEVKYLLERYYGFKAT
jgi:hypothetical protein